MHHLREQIDHYSEWILGGLIIISLAVGFFWLRPIFAVDITAGLTQGEEEVLDDNAHVPCERSNEGTYIKMTATCSIDDIDLSDGVYFDAITSVASNVSAIYDIERTEFDYSGADLIFDKNFLQTVEQLDTLIEKDYLEIVSLPTAYVAYKQKRARTFHAAVRDTMTYGSCRKTNYDIAMDQLDGYVLTPDEHLNMNRLITDHPDYCTGTGGKFMFYQGVCGGSTQLFWVSLLNPMLEVTKRYAHGQWYAGFYGSAVIGDDASMYEMNKQFEVKNASDQPVYFATLTRESDGNTILISGTPLTPGSQAALGYSVAIKKEQTGPRSAVLSKQVFDPSGATIRKAIWESNYRGINNESDND